MDFIDEVVIRVRSGDGGRGCVSFRRERFRPKGGPDGGDGGKGGDIILRVSPERETLSHFGSRRYFKAQNGEPGRGDQKTGKDGNDCIIEVPPGTKVYDEDTGELLGDLIHISEELVVAKGGKGGKGNTHFATSTNRAPRYAQKGMKGEEKRLRLSLIYIADVGIIGLPNVGKSTLLSRITNARPKIESYLFTTIVPGLGVLNFEDEIRLIIADIPGLIEGASKGKGLGLRFLKHAERTKLLLHIVDISNVSLEDPLKDYMTLRKELSAYGGSLSQKPHMVILNKIDLKEKEPLMIENTISKFKEIGVEVMGISALKGYGLEELKSVLYKKLNLLEEG